MSNVQKRSKTFYYKVGVRWQEAKKGMLSSEGKPDVIVATPPEFLGHAGCWSPENLFVASISSCIMTTFLYYAKKQKLQFIRYNSDAEGILEMVNGQFMFSQVTVRPKLVIPLSEDKDKAENIFELSEKNCLISNSVKSKVIILPEIIMGS